MTHFTLQQHSPEWHEFRRGGIGGSDAKIIMAGDWRDLWAEKTGRTQPEDLTNVLMVQIGIVTEPLNIWWFARQTGLPVSTDPATCANLTRPDHLFMRCNLDGLIDANTILEAKHCTGFGDDENAVTRYYWQLQHNMAVTGAKKAYLSCFFGTTKWEAFEVLRDDEDIAILTAREQEFWGYVERDEMPPAKPGTEAPSVAFDAMRSVDMTGNNAWAGFAADYLENQDAAKKFETAKKGLKDSLESDVKKASGHGVIVTRAKNNAITVKASKG